jgi:hypothetical protein
MGWLDRLMDRLTARGPKLAGSGHPPADVQPPTGSPELSGELESDYGPDAPAAEPPSTDAGGGADDTGSSAG